MNWIFTIEGGVLWDKNFDNFQKIRNYVLIILNYPCNLLWKALWGDIASDNVNVVNYFPLFFPTKLIRFWCKMQCSSFAVFHCLY